MFKNVATKIALFAFDVTTGAAKTGDAANLTAYVSKDFGTVTALADTSATEMDATNAKGWYLFDAAQGETNADDLLFTGKSSTANVSVVGRQICTTPNRFTTMVIDASGLVDANAVKVGPTGSGTAQTARDLGASVLLSAGTGTGQLDFTSGVVKANATQLAGQTITAGAGVTFPASVASPTNITAGTITTVTNLTNAPTAGDFTATMKTSIGTAVAASAVASVTGNVGGNVTGSVGSVVGSVASVTGLTASDVGAIKTIADKLDDTLEDDAGTYRFTQNALEEAPSGSGASAADIADAVWDEAIADHQSAGSTGESLNDAGGSGNPWNAVIEGSLTAQDFLRIIAATKAGKTSIVKNGNGTATVTFRDLTDSSDIVVGTAQRSERISVTLNP